MSFVDAKNERGEIQTIPEHWLTVFPGQFTSITPAKPAPPVKADNAKKEAI